MQSQDSGRIAAIFVHRIERGADAIQIADAVVFACGAIDAALSPILGRAGVLALYKRSLYLIVPTYPWLADISIDMQTSVDLAALKSAFAQQHSTDVAAAGGALLQTLHELLISLIGPALTEQLLRTVWANFFPQDSAS